jgi:hypothetical protein
MEEKEGLDEGNYTKKSKVDGKLDEGSIYL